MYAAITNRSNAENSEITVVSNGNLKLKCLYVVLARLFYDSFIFLRVSVNAFEFVPRNNLNKRCMDFVQSIFYSLESLFNMNGNV